MKSDQPQLAYIAACCVFLDVHIDDVTGYGRGSRPVVSARQFICWALKRRYELSYPHIARLLNRKEHTTVLSNVRRVDRALAGGERWALRMRELCWPEEVAAE